MSHHNSLTGLLDLWVLLAHPPNQLSLGLNEPTASSKPGMIAYVMSIGVTRLSPSHSLFGKKFVLNWKWWWPTCSVVAVVLPISMSISTSGLRSTIATLWCCHLTQQCHPITGTFTTRVCPWATFSSTLLRSGAITGALTGSPCETYSAARHHPPPPDWEGARWPRPLRSHNRLFGLEKLTNREMRQLHQGTIFFMQVVEVFGVDDGSGRRFCG